MFDKSTIMFEKLFIKSGFDWNFENSTIMFDKSAYDEYVKVKKIFIKSVQI